jgi:cytochrome c5
MCSQAQQLFLNFVPDLPEEKTMRYLSILIAATLTLLFTSACQEESQPVAKEVPKVIAQQHQEAATAAETAEKNTEELMEKIKEEEQKSIEHAKAQAHQIMDASDEKMAAMHDGSFSEEALATGQRVYEQTCAACHATGLAGAPKTGDKEAWSAHIHHGLDHMVESAINGKGAMPAKGGNASLSDDEVKAAVSYIVEQSR